MHLGKIRKYDWMTVALFYLIISHQPLEMVGGKRRKMSEKKDVQPESARRMPS